MIKSRIILGNCKKNQCSSPRSIFVWVLSLNSRVWDPKRVLNNFTVCSNVAVIELKFNIYFCLENFGSVVVLYPVGSASVWRIRISIQGLQILIRIGIYFNKCKAKFHFFQENFNKLFKILKTMTPLMLKRKNVNWHYCE